MTDGTEQASAIEYAVWRVGNYDWIRDKLTALAADLVGAGHDQPHLDIAMLAADLMAEQIGRVDAAVCLEARARNLRAVAGGRRPEDG